MIIEKFILVEVLNFNKEKIKIIRIYSIQREREIVFLSFF